MSNMLTMHKVSEIMTLEEVSVYLRIPRSSLYKLAREGKVPCQKIGKHWRFHKNAIDAWISLESRKSA